MITRTRYAVAYLNPSSTEIEEVEIEVWGVDEMRAELEARRFGLLGPTVNKDKTVTDLGDANNRQALDVWAALVRLGLYTGKSPDFRTKHCVGIKKVGDPDDHDPDSSTSGVEPVDPTRQADPTRSA